VAAATAVAKDGIEFDRTQAHVGDRIALASSWTSHPNTPNGGPPPEGILRVVR
jgi:hypothetical protein